MIAKPLTPKNDGLTGFAIMKPGRRETPGHRNRSRWLLRCIAEANANLTHADPGDELR